MGHGHDHGHGGHSASERHLSRLWLALAITATFMVAEFVVAALTNSLATLSDAAHMLTDVAGLGMAIAAISLARRSKPNNTRTFGFYRAEVFAALANSILLFAVAIYVVTEAVLRFDDPPLVPGWPVLIVGLGGIAANCAAFLVLRAGSKESVNVRGAYLEVVADLVGSVGVVISAIVTLTIGWRYADLTVGVAIGLWVLPRTFDLARRSLRILFQHSPKQLDIDAVVAQLAALDGVTDVHDLHVWTLTSGMEVASAHVTVSDGADHDAVLAAAQELLEHEFTIEHATLQVESLASAQRCSELSW